MVMTWNVVLWVVAPCSLLCCYRRFGRTYILHLQERSCKIRWRRYVPPKLWQKPTRFHRVTTRKIIIHVYLINVKGSYMINVVGLCFNTVTSRCMVFLKQNNTETQWEQNWIPRLSGSSSLPSNKYKNALHPGLRYSPSFLKGPHDTLTSCMPGCTTVTCIKWLMSMLT
jgi:hypothetical protein